MMTLSDYILRPAVPGDVAAVDDLLARSYPQLLAADYPAAVLGQALPLICKAQPALLASGRYYLAVAAGGRVLGAGGYSLAPPGQDGLAPAKGAGRAHIRHVATDPHATRRGIGRALMARIFADAEGLGVAGYDCLSTRTAVPFYAALGFAPWGEVQVPLAPGVSFPAVQMRK